MKTVISQNQNRTATTARSLGRIYDPRKAAELEKDGYLFRPSVVELTSVFFERTYGHLDADEPVRSIFENIVSTFMQRGGSKTNLSYNEKLKRPRANHYPRLFFAAIEIKGVPVYAGNSPGLSLEELLTI